MKSQFVVHLALKNLGQRQKVMVKAKPLQQQVNKVQIIKRQKIHAQSYSQTWSKAKGRQPKGWWEREGRGFKGSTKG
jgi:hypothetical protein